jgi:pimeloyl-ACP methyl ester carboxylesterase
MIGDMARQVADQARAEVVRNVGHWSPEESPQPVVEHLLRLFRSSAA